MEWFRSLLQGRPAWVNAVMIFCGYMALLYVPWDLFVKPVESDVEVWFGYMFTGWAAKVAAVPHWIVYAVFAYGLYHMRTWVWPWLAVYVAQIAVGMLVWSVVAIGGLGGWLSGLVTFAVFGSLASYIWSARDRLAPPEVT